MQRMGESRRRFLKGVGTAATLGTVVGAGCLNNSTTGSPSTDDGTGGTTETATDSTDETSGTTTTTTIPDRDYPSSRWVPSPGSLTDVASFAVGQRSTSALSEHTGKMSEDAAFEFNRPTNSRARWFGLDAGKIDTIVKFGPPVEADPDLTGMNVVLETSYEDDDLISAIQTEGATDQTETYGGYSLHRMSGRTVGVADGVLVACIQTGGISATNLTKRVIDTAGGEFPSYYESLSLYRRGRQELGNVDLGRVVTHDPTSEDDPANGVFLQSMTEAFRWQFNVSGAEVRLAVIFSRAEHANPDLVREFADSADAMAPVDYSVSTEDDVVVLDGTVGYEDIVGDVPYPPAFTN